MKKILVVEDEKGLTEEIEEYLKNIGYSVNIANDKSQALKFLDREHFDVVIQDLRIPEVLGHDKPERSKGLDLLGLINYKYSNTCTIVITVFDQVKDAVDTMQAGAYNHVSKPFKLADLKNTIEKGIEHQSLKKELEAEKKKQDEYILRLAHGLIHVVKNSLWLISGNSQLLAESSHSKKNERLIEIIQTHADKSNKVLEEFLSFRKRFKNGKELGEKESTQVVDLIDSAIFLVTSFPWKNRRIKIKKGKIEEGLPEINTNRFLLQEVLINIIKNGVEAIEEGKSGEVKIDARRVDGFVEINVKDNGLGVYSEDLKKVRKCEAFFTTKEYGTGLGLCASKLILNWHEVNGKKGEIDIDSKFNEWTKVTIKIPYS